VIAFVKDLTQQISCVVNYLYELERTFGEDMSIAVANRFDIDEVGANR
jgi:hypothetical protein